MFSMTFCRNGLSPNKGINIFWRLSFTVTILERLVKKENYLRTIGDSYKDNGKEWNETLIFSKKTE